MHCSRQQDSLEMGNMDRGEKKDRDMVEIGKKEIDGWKEYCGGVV